MLIVLLSNIHNYTNVCICCLCIKNFSFPCKVLYAVTFFTTHKFNSLYQDRESNTNQAMDNFEWLLLWLQHLTGTQADIRVPDLATSITSPLVPEQWHPYLYNHPDRKLQHFFISGIRSGFQSGCTASSSTFKSSHMNLVSTRDHPEVINDYLATEPRKSHIAGPFKKATIPDAHISRFGIIPKKAVGK